MNHSKCSHKSAVQLECLTRVVEIRCRHWCSRGTIIASQKKLLKGRFTWTNTSAFLCNTPCNKRNEEWPKLWAIFTSLIGNTHWNASMHRYWSMREKGSQGGEQRGEKREMRSGWNEGETRGRKEEARMKSGRECGFHTLYLPSEELQEHHNTRSQKEPKWKKQTNKCLLIPTVSN